MKVTKFDNGISARKILAGMIHNPTVLGKVRQFWTKESNFADRESSTIGQWCIDYYDKYGKPPKQSNLRSLAVVWAESHTASDVSQVDALLSQVFADYERNGKNGSDYLVDLAGDYFTGVRLDRVIAKVSGLRELGRNADASRLLKSFEEVSLLKETGTHFFLDKEELKSLFVEDDSKAIFTYPGPLGHFVKDLFCPEALVAVMAAEGTGKTMWLVDIAWRAMMNRKRVAFFEVGDMSRRQINWRFLIRAAGRPRKKGTIRIPTSWDGNKPLCTAKEYQNEMSFDYAEKKWAQVQEQLKTGSSYFYLEDHATESISAKGIGERLKELERRDGYVPDIVLMDYADILAPIDSKRDFRHQQAQTWAALRALALEWHCCVVTATQANRESYDNKGPMKRRNISEDKRKLGYASGYLGLTQTDDEKEMGVMKLNCLKDREDDYNSKITMMVAGCMAMSQPAMISAYRSREEKEDEG